MIPWKRKEVIGNAELYLGDCLEILPHLPDVDLAVTSPPYNIKKKWWGDRHRAGMHERLQAKFTDEWYDDELPEQEYQEWQKEIIRACLIKTRIVCYNHKVRYAIKREGMVIHPMTFLASFPLWSEVIWDRGSGPAQNCRRPVPADERIYVLTHKPPVWNDLGYTSVWRIPATAQRLGHPCPFPIEIPLRCIGQFTNQGQIVLDPFMGAGTTGIACERACRKFIGIEIEQKYFDIACERIENAQRQERLFA